jgi:hypothetical protein
MKLIAFIFSATQEFFILDGEKSLEFKVPHLHVLHVDV